MKTRFLVYLQARSAFAMAFTTLTNVKAIQHLGPDRSIIGSIIRPDAILVERKGGSTGKVTFDNLFPDSGKPSLQLLYDHQEVYCNWPMNNEDEEPLPRGSGNGTGCGSDVNLSEKKRKVYKENKSSKRTKRHGTPGMSNRHDNSSMKGPKKRKWGDNQNGYSAGSSRRRWHH